MPDRARQQRQAREHDRESQHRRTVGHDLGDAEQRNDPVREQRSQRWGRPGRTHDQQLDGGSHPPSDRSRAGAEGARRNGDREQDSLAVPPASPSPATERST
jgi:hypothetical protein